MTQCTNCAGGGLVGVGEQPWLRQGPISTCPNCAGTGILVDSETLRASEPVPLSNLQGTSTDGIPPDDEPKKNEQSETDSNSSL